MNERFVGPAGRAHDKCCCEHPALGLCPSILLSYDGSAFVARVLGSSSLEGRGSSYGEALASIEQVMTTHRNGASIGLPNQPSVVRRKPVVRRHMATVKARLVQRFGNLSNREMAARLGVVARDAPSMLSNALSGRGARALRCSIAVALNEFPSVLWPDRQQKTQQDDDAEYREQKLYSSSSASIAEPCARQTAE